MNQCMRNTDFLFRRMNRCVFFSVLRYVTVASVRVSISILFWVFCSLLSVNCKIKFKAIFHFSVEKSSGAFWNSICISFVLFFCCSFQVIRMKEWKSEIIFRFLYRFSNIATNFNFYFVFSDFKNWSQLWIDARRKVVFLMENIKSERNLNAFNW